MTTHGMTIERDRLARIEITAEPEKFECPRCGSEKTFGNGTRRTKTRYVRCRICKDCRHYYEVPIEG